jgi:hypothetical protein
MSYDLYRLLFNNPLGLQKDCPEQRDVQPPDVSRIVSIPEVGGLHHRYERRAA